MITSDLLIHEATAYNVVGLSADRKPTYGSGVNLSNIRISLKKGFVNGSHGLEVGDAMTLFFDCENSKPYGWKPVEKMRITFGEENYTVKSFKAHYSTSNSPAFYTAELV